MSLRISTTQPGFELNVVAMHASFFEYNLSRPYPFKWFTPIVIFFGPIAVVMFSLLNFVTSSYTLAGRYTSDPNATITETRLHWPSFLASKLQPTCQSTSIPVDTKLLTNNSALTYTLTNVLQNANEANQTLSPALIYHNNILPDCTVTSVSLQVASLARTAAQIALINWGVVAQAFITCRLDTEDQKITIFNLTAEYDFMPPTVSIYSGFTTFIGRNQTSKPSLYWGESLLSMYWLKLATDVDVTHISDGNQTATSGTLIYTVNGSTADISDNDFFDVQWRFIVPYTDNTHMVYVGDQRPNFGSSGSHYDISVSADTLAKSMYSTVLTDLGQRGAVANILTSSELLEHFTANFSAIVEEDNRGGPARSPYTLNRSGLLVETSSVFKAIYLCQVPQHKSTGSMLLTILVADLVFLQAVWRLWKLVVEAYMNRADKQASFCEGCRRTQDTQALGQDDADSRSTFSRLSRSGKHAGYEMVPVVSQASVVTSRSFF